MCKSIKFAAAAVAAMAVGFAATVHAQSARELCYSLEPLGDILKLNFDPQENKHQLVYGLWFSPSHSFRVVGAYDSNVDGSGRRLSITGTTADDFGDETINRCSIDGTLGGNFSIFCNSIAQGNFDNSGGPLTRVGCRGVRPSSGGPSATVRPQQTR